MRAGAGVVTLQSIAHAVAARRWAQPRRRYGRMWTEREPEPRACQEREAPRISALPSGQWGSGWRWSYCAVPRNRNRTPLPGNFRYLVCACQQQCGRACTQPV